MIKVYCCFLDLDKIIVEEHIGKLRIDKNHPRIYFPKLKHSCIGLECFNKIMFKTKEEAEAQANKLQEITWQEWEAWIKEIKDRKNWLTIEQVKTLNLGEKINE